MLLKIKDNSSRAKTSLIFVIITMGLYAIMAYMWFDLYSLLTSGQLEEFMNRALMIDQLALGTQALYIINGIIFMHWFRRAYNNLHILRAEGLSQGESMAVWGWVIPIASYFIPVTIMQQIWKGNNEMLVKAGRPEGNQQSQKGLISVWWALWVIGNILLIYGRFTIDSVSTIDEVESVILVQVAALGSFVLSGIFLISIMKKITEVEKLVFPHGPELLEGANEQRKLASQKAKEHVKKVQAQAQMRRPPK